MKDKMQMLVMFGVLAAFIAVVIMLPSGDAPLAQVPVFNNTGSVFIAQPAPEVDCATYELIRDGIDPYAQPNSAVWNMQYGPYNVLQRAKEIC